MTGNTFGKIFRITTWGESHGKAVGVVVDGCPAGLVLNEGDIQQELDRRRPGQSKIATDREERDEAKILSGIFEGRTTGTPISILIENKDVRSGDYEKFKNMPRPGHADFTYWKKYGVRDYRGGGRASGRETVGRVAAGAIAKKLLSLKKIEIIAHVIQVGKIKAKSRDFDEIKKNVEKNPVRCADMAVAILMEEKIMGARKEGDSIGGVVEVIAKGVPAGLGEPVFDKLDSDLAKALMSIGAVKGIEIGLGFGYTDKLGSDVKDEFYMKDGDVRTRTNNAGGILGGISNGEEIVCRIAVKPTSSIAKPQKTVDLVEMKEREIEIGGRHDPCICPRIAPVAESMVSLVLVDHMLLSGLVPRNL
ncbi:MAG: chorismate synthase [Candidatus Methanolliviera sp. GoM_asphalt]|nr:MAG: chorismate synthase [Candidatus Methanolliviera sp. GoM_asphalt]